MKFRLINRDTVLPGQTLLFMKDQTLKERKLEVYVLIKILKYCTGSSAKSYQCKFAMDRAFSNKSIESLEEVGPAIKRIIQYRTLRGKFSSVHPDLAVEGITKVEVGEEGLFFIKGGVKGSLDRETVGLPHHDENEEELLRRAIAMSLEGQEEELPFGTGLILKDDIA